VTTTDTRSPESDPAGECRPLRADARRNRERILAAAREVFAESGAEAQIDDVARRAGVGVGTVYRHFATKEQLLAELVRQKFRLFADRAREALEQHEEPFAALIDVMRRNAETAAQDAATQHALAIANAPYVKTMIPVDAMSDFGRYGVRHNGAFELRFFNWVMTMGNSAGTPNAAAAAARAASDPAAASALRSCHSNVATARFVF